MKTGFGTQRMMGRSFVVYRGERGTIAVCSHRYRLLAKICAFTRRRLR